MPVRFRIFGLLFGLTIVAYVQRTAVSIAGARMMPDLHLTQVQLGWLETAFLISYATLQFPGSVTGQKVGARRMITLCALVSVAAALAMPLAPSVFSGGALFLALLAAQFVLGASQAPFFGLLAGVVERWFPPRDWSRAQGWSAAGLGGGAAAAPAIIAPLMVTFGWRAALIITALPVLALVAWWWIEARDSPREHRGVSAAELAETAATAQEDPPRLRHALRLLAHPSLAMLTLGYTAMNVVFYLITFWSFLYLVQARHFSLLAGGFAAMAPPLTGAVGAALGGMASAAAAARFGDRWGLRLVALVTLPIAGALLLLAVHVPQAWLALTCLSLSFGFLEMNEATFWTAAMQIGRRDAAAACGMLNTGGNVGGIIATPVVAFLSSHGGWNLSFEAGAGFAVAAGLIWLLIDPATPAVRKAERPSPPPGGSTREAGDGGFGAARAPVSNAPRSSSAPPSPPSAVLPPEGEDGIVGSIADGGIG